MPRGLPSRSDAVRVAIELPVEPLVVTVLPSPPPIVHVPASSVIRYTRRTPRPSACRNAYAPEPASRPMMAVVGNGEFATHSGGVWGRAAPLAPLPEERTLLDPLKHHRGAGRGCPWCEASIAHSAREHVQGTDLMLDLFGHHSLLRNELDTSASTPRIVRYSTVLLASITLSRSGHASFKRARARLVRRAARAPTTPSARPREPSSCATATRVPASTRSSHWRRCPNRPSTSTSRTNVACSSRPFSTPSRRRTTHTRRPSARSPRRMMSDATWVGTRDCCSPPS